MKRSKPLQRKTQLKASQGLPRRSPPKTQRQLAPVGRRGKRLRSGDRAEEKASHPLPCVCGCGAELDPGQVARAHLKRRALESTRNEPTNNLPACWWLGEWLDHTADGVRTKPSLWALAIGLGRRLEQADVEPVIREAGYYEWRAKADTRGSDSAD